MGERESKNPHAVLQRIIDENPGADRAAIDDLFFREVMDDSELKRAVIKWVSADFRKRSQN